MSNKKNELLKLINIYPKYEYKKIMELNDRCQEMTNAEYWDIKISIKKIENFEYDSYFTNLCDNSEKEFYKEALEISKISLRGSLMMLRFFLDKVLRRILPFAKYYKKTKGWEKKIRTQLKKHQNYILDEHGESGIKNREVLDNIEKKLNQNPDLLFKKEPKTAEMLDFRTFSELLTNLNDAILENEFSIFISNCDLYINLDTKSSIVLIDVLIKAFNSAVHDSFEPFFRIKDILTIIDLSLFFLNFLDYYKK